MLGDLDPALLPESQVGIGPEHVEAQCALLERLGGDPRNVDDERLRAEHPGLETLRLPGSGLVVTLGELNVLPDYLAHPAEIETAPEAFLLPLIQSIRSLNITELRRSAGRPGRRPWPRPRPRLEGSLKYPRLRGLAEIGEVLEVEWLADARVPCIERHVLAGMTTSQQPFLHGPGHYDRMAAGPGAPDAASSQPPWDPQSVVEAPTLAARIEASGVIGTCEQERRDAYAAYLAMLGSSVAQLAACLLHGYFNKRSLVVAAGPDGPRFRIGGDRTLLTGGDGALHAFRATAVSRRAVSELLARGETGITIREIFEGFPDHVEQGGTLVTLRQWHDSSMRDLCFGELFSLWRTAAMRILASAIFRRFGVPSPDVEALQAAD